MDKIIDEISQSGGGKFIILGPRRSGKTLCLQKLAAKFGPENVQVYFTSQRQKDNFGAKVSVKDERDIVFVEDGDCQNLYVNTIECSLMVCTTSDEIWAKMHEPTFKILELTHFA